jgi:hypothetical protein
VERKRVLIHLPLFFLQFLPVFLYAETHYRFRYFFSLLRKHEPEIIADAPYRIEPNSPLPLLIIVKDANLFPIKLNQISVIIQSDDKIVSQQKLVEHPIEINEIFWWRVYNISIDGLSGYIQCDVRFEIEDKERKRYYRNDNYRTSSHKSLSIFASSSALPRFDNLYFGECHSHSSYTDDQVEFGSPLKASAQLSKSLGLSFFCSTDHSYDLDDALDNYLLNDPGLAKWKLFQKEIGEFDSRQEEFVIIRGEEVTCRNYKSRNVHFLLLGNKKFYAGSGDGAEKWFKTRSELSISDILDDIDPGILSFAAHPKEPVSILQRLLLNRGKWHDKDFDSDKLTGIQFINGIISKGFWNGYRQWIKALLQGKRLLVLAGNDAHGNFNRFRQIGIPFLKIRESSHQLFGKLKTGAFIESLSENNILHAIEAGNIIVTDGPVVNMKVTSSRSSISSIGCKYVGKRHTVLIEVRSTIEYGAIDLVRIFLGQIGISEKEMFLEIPSQTYDVNKISTFDIETTTYIRAEAWTSSTNSKDRQKHFCLTNPIWFSPS